MKPINQAIVRILKDDGKTTLSSCKVSAPDAYELAVKCGMRSGRPYDVVVGHVVERYLAGQGPRGIALDDEPRRFNIRSLPAKRKLLKGAV